jgi:AraC-like DNA-binding protein
MALLARGMAWIDLLHLAGRRPFIGSMLRAHPILPPYMSSQVADARRFYLSMAERGADAIRVVSGGWERCAADYSIVRTGFPYLTLEFVAAGAGTLRMGGRTHALCRGSVFAYGPRIGHAIATDADDRLSKYFVNLAGRRAPAMFEAAAVPPGAMRAVAAIDEVQAAYEQLLFAGRRGTETSSKMANLQAQILLLLVSEVRLPSPGRANAALHTFVRCRELAEESFLALDTAEDLAKACHVAPEYLSRLFVRFAGQPPYRFLMRLKMHHAAMLLEQHLLLVREAADAVRMDPFQFSRAFKRVHGLSPIAFLHARLG